jgi:hypothetical protein
MGTGNQGRIDVLKKPGIMLPHGFKKAEDIGKIVAAEVQSIEKPIDADQAREWAKEEEAQKTLFEKFDATKSDSLGWVQKNEVAIAKKRIIEALGFEPPPMCGFYMCVAVHEQSEFAHLDDGSRTNILLADSTRDEDKFKNASGLVISQGPWCYTGEHFKEPLLEKICRFFFGRWMKPSIYRPWCRVGDWVAMPRHEGQLFNFRGTPVMMIRDTKIYTPVENPNHIKREF